MTAPPNRHPDAASTARRGYWVPTDPPGNRRFLDLGGLELESGDALPEVTVAFETWGELNAAGDNAVLIEHALTGDSHVVGEAGPGHPTAGWWADLIGPGRPLDSRRWFVVAANVLGGCQGSTGPSSPAPDGRPWGSRFPHLTIRDQVEAERRLADHLRIDRWAGVIGGSMGGMRVLEWAVGHSERVEAAVVIASTAEATADQIAWCEPQLLAISLDPQFRGGDYYDGPGPQQGLAIARRIAHTTYRSGAELDERFGRSGQDADRPDIGRGRYAVESYLDHAADKLVARFDPNSYLVLTRAMNSHDVGRGRGGTAAALTRITARTLVAYVDSDRLYPQRLSQRMADAIPGARLAEVNSRHGHDGFLIETEQVGRLVVDHLVGSGGPSGVSTRSSAAIG